MEIQDTIVSFMNFKANVFQVIPVYDHNGKQGTVTAQVTLLAQGVGGIGRVSGVICVWGIHCFLA